MLSIRHWMRDRLDTETIIAAARRVLREHGLVTDAAASPAGRLPFDEGDPGDMFARAPRTFSLMADPAAGATEIVVGIDHTPVFAPVHSADWLMVGHGERRSLTASDVGDCVAVAGSLGELSLSAGGLWLRCAGLSVRDRIVAFATATGGPLIADLGHDVATHAVLAAVRATSRGSALPARSAGRPQARLVGMVAIDGMLQVPAATVEAISGLASSGAAIVIAPTLILGANCPAAVEGALVRFTAEVMGIASFAQTLHPGAIVMAGVRVAEASMRTGMPMVGTAASLRVTAGAIEIARQLDLPVAALGPATGAHAIDAQAGGDTALWLAVAADADMVIGAAGGLDLDCAISLEKLILDCDLIRSLSAGVDGAEVIGAAAPPTDWARAIIELGVGGNALASPATREVARSRRSRRLPDEWLYETYDAAGRPDSAMRARAVVSDSLARKNKFDPSEDYAARRDAVAAAVDQALATTPTGEMHCPPDASHRLSTIASDLYSAAMRDAFGFGG